jgi:hypothetical protein
LDCPRQSKIVPVARSTRHSTRSGVVEGKWDASAAHGVRRGFSQDFRQLQQAMIHRIFPSTTDLRSAVPLPIFDREERFGCTTRSCLDNRIAGTFVQFAGRSRNSGKRIPDSSARKRESSFSVKRPEKEEEEAGSPLSQG